MRNDVGNFTRRVNIPNQAISDGARDVYGMISRMNHRELEGVRARVQARLGNSSSTQIADDDRANDVDWLLCGIEAELRARGLLRGGAHLPVDRICPKYRVLSRHAIRTLQGSIGNRPRASDLAALGRLAAACLADYIESKRVTVSPRTMLQQAGEAAAAIDAAFPGYSASGMLRMCLQR